MVPALALCANKNRRRWLPSELIFEMLSFMQPAKVWGVKRVLTTCTTIYRLIAGSKNVKNWRKPYFVLQIEATYENTVLLPLCRFPLLLRRHHQNLPFWPPHLFKSIVTVGQYFKVRDGTPFYQLLIVLNHRRFPYRPNTLLCARLNGATDVMFDHCGVEQFLATDHQDYVMATFTFHEPDNGTTFEDICNALNALLQLLSDYVDNVFPESLE